MRILAIDYGKKRTGIAVTDPLQIISHPLETIETKNIFPFFEKYLSEEKVKEIVIGHPKHADDTDAVIFGEIKKFAEKLQKNHPDIKFAFQDERYSSKRAMESMIEGGYKKKDRRKKGNIDKMAALIILRDYLETK
jgi:putative pre-16S rRNA nuclease